jgi:hypothetical protein
MSMITSDDYTFMENPMSENWAVHIKTGPWEGVQYAYGKIGLRENPDQEGATLQFNYAILDACDFEEDVLKCDNDFNNHIGDILSHILDDAIQNDKFRLGNNERTDATNGS